MTALRVVIADDEPLARSRLRALLADHADVVIAAEAEDADAALQAIRSERPDLVLLDVEMPGLGGVALARRLHMTPAPLIVFVTAYADHAVDAFRNRRHRLSFKTVRRGSSGDRAHSRAGGAGGPARARG
ncbi:response regulator [Nannocystis pusilla]|uniref:Response regulator n=1 Tax=Nannocystis pusilla TaxID=889268 RepID=A0A9X3EI30_9BACT|nr:response regulator [Nannocystis pusilla]MCY1004115.1 response regulator [Nannocystis pusilla]